MERPEADVLIAIFEGTSSYEQRQLRMNEVLDAVTERAKIQRDELISRLELEEERGRMRKEALKVEMRENEMLRDQLSDAKAEIARLEKRERELEARAERAEAMDRARRYEAYESGALDFAQSQPEQSDLMGAFDRWVSQIQNAVDHE